MNTQSSKHQEYTYTAQSVHTDGAASVVYTEAGFWVQPPENTITHERLFVDIVVQFHSSIPLSDCRVDQIGIVPSASYQTNQLPENRRMLDVALLADSDRLLHIKMNLSALLVKDRVSRDITDDDHNIPILVFPPEATAYNIWSPEAGFFINVPPVINWWKNDSLYTTIGQV